MRTLENCAVIKRGIRLGVGSPEVTDGKCSGYQNGEDDEPIEKCKHCRFCSAYDME